MPKIRIVSVPPGEAPTWVREKWVGLELPLSFGSKAINVGTVGVLTGPHTVLGQLWRRLRGRGQTSKGFAVDAAEAVRILEALSPEAAAWWRASVPSLLQNSRRFLFHEQACQVVPD